MIVAPGETIGILGGGQLGRMLAMAAAQLGYRCHVYAPEADSVAAEVCAQFTRAAYDDAEALAEFAAMEVAVNMASTTRLHCQIVSPITRIP